MFLKEWMADNHGIMRRILIKSSCLSKSNLPSIMMAKSKRQFRIMILLTQIACLSLLIVKLVDLNNGGGLLNLQIDFFMLPLLRNRDVCQ